MSTRETRRRKNIVLSSDGTGKSGGSGGGTNVWKLHEAVDLHCHEDASEAPAQIVYHDDGVGTDTFKLFKLLGGAFGMGLAANVRQLYTFLAQNYDLGDDIYLFGFSRGAFTVRCLAGLIQAFGVPQRSDDLDDRVRKAWLAFRLLQLLPPGSERIRRPEPAHFYQQVKIKFVGVWDTVDAYGLPMDELTDAAHRVTRLFAGIPILGYPIREMGLGLLRFRAHELSPCVEHGRHAVSIDDERHTFHPLMWEEQGLDPKSRLKTGQALEQVWFPGVHADVGGGYAKGSLALAALQWMMEGAQHPGVTDAEHVDGVTEPQLGLRFVTRRLEEVKSAANPLGRIHDSRSGGSVFYRYRPREADHADPEVTQLAAPKVHSIALERIVRSHGAYAPTALPNRFTVVGKTDHAALRPAQNHIEDARCLISVRRLLYFTFLAWTGAMVWGLVEFTPRASAGPEPPWGIVGGLFSAGSRYLPSPLAGWVLSIRQEPLLFWSLFGGGAILIGVREKLRAWTLQTARRAWGFQTEASVGAKATIRLGSVLRGSAQSRQQWHRRNGWATRVASSFTVIAVLVAVAYLGIPPAAHTGAPPMAVARTPVAHPVPLLDGKVETVDFDTRNPANATGVYLVQGQDYRVTIFPMDDWNDGTYLASPVGIVDRPSLIMKLFTPFRRSYEHQWFEVLASIGGPNARASGQVEPVGDTRFEIGITAESSGQLYLYVNDATNYFPSWVSAWHFYANNTGTARVAIEHLARSEPEWDWRRQWPRDWSPLEPRQTEGS